jgi:hypothetical protein
MRARGPVGRPPFHPRQLFTVADLGFVHDPRVAGALFEESTGITPITSAGRPNGLILDGRFGFTRGIELVKNGDGSAGTADWTPVDSTLSNVSGKIRVTASSSFGRANQSFSAVIGKFYEVLCTSFFVSGTNKSYIAKSNDGIAMSLVSSLGGTDGASGGKRLIFTANATTTFISLGATVGGSVIDFDDISAREVIGNHAIQASSPSRPIFQTSPARVVFDGMDDSHTTNFASSLGSACTVARAIPGTGAQILTGQTIGTSFTNTTTHAGMVVINRALTSTETANLTRWLNRAAGL